MFYHKYIALCNKRGISPSAAAEEIGFYRSDVTRWSKGSNPRQASLQKIADYFGVPVAYLIDEGQKESPPQGGEPLKEALLEIVNNTDDEAFLLEIMSAVAARMKERNERK